MKTICKSKVIASVALVAALLLGCKQSKEKEVDFSVLEEKLVTKEEAKKMSRQFVADLQQMQALVMQDTLQQRKVKVSASAHFTLQEIEQYIAYAKQEAAKSGKKVEGLRIYYGVYTKGKNKDYTTVFLVPTGSSNKQEGSIVVFQSKPGDLDVSPMNDGGMGDPPNATYPQGQ